VKNDPYGLLSSGLPPEMAARARGLTRQQAVAEAMLEQSQSPIDINRMAGGYVVPVSPFEGLAKLGKAYFGRKALDDADAKALALGNEYQNMTANEVARYAQRKAGTPESTIPAAPYEAPIGAEDSSAQTGAPVTIPAQPADPRGAVIEAITSRNPVLQKLGQLDYAQMAKQAEPYTLPAGAVRIGADGKPMASAPFKPDAPKVQQPSNLSRLIAERDAIPEGDPRRAAYDNAIRKESETAKQISPTIVMPKPEKADKVPLGYRMTENGNLEAIPGGPADTKIQGALNQDTANLQGGIADLDRLAVEANKVLAHPGLKGITGLMGKIPNIPGSDAANAEALLGTLKSQVGFGVLQAMRNASKTGGALGSVSDAEGKRLEANLASLEKAQSFEQFQQSLNQIIKFTDEAKDRMRNAYNMRHPAKGAASAAPAANPGASGGWSIQRVP